MAIVICPNCGGCLCSKCRERDGFVDIPDKKVSQLKPVQEIKKIPDVLGMTTGPDGGGING